MKTFLTSIPLLLFCGAATAQTLTLYGTMHHTTIEGGCWYLHTDDGKRYELTGDTSVVNPLRVDSQRVGVQAEVAKGAASICMVGEIVRVIKRIGSIRHAYDPLIMPFVVDGRMHREKSGFWYVKTPDGKEYEFKVTPEKKYLHSGARFHQKARVLFDKGYLHDKKMDGVILSDSPPQPKEKNIPKKYDPR
jgi:hypothetical protein